MSENGKKTKWPQLNITTEKALHNCNRKRNNYN